MSSMVLTFEWTDEGHGRDVIADERMFAIKDEKDVKKDITAWVKEMYKADKGKHKHFEVCRRYGCKGRRMWVCYGTKPKMNWSINFMSWAELIMSCTMNYLGWERDIEADQRNGSGYTFVSRNGIVKWFTSLEDLDGFIKSEMRLGMGD